MESSEEGIARQERPNGSRTGGSPPSRLPSEKERRAPRLLRRGPRAPARPGPAPQSSAAAQPSAGPAAARAPRTPPRGRPGHPGRPRVSVLRAPGGGGRRHRRRHRRRARGDLDAVSFALPPSPGAADGPGGAAGCRPCTPVAVCVRMRRFFESFSE